MPRHYQGVKVPEGFTRYMTKKFKRKIPGLKNPYKFTVWSLSHHMKRKTLKREVREFKRRR